MMATQPLSLEKYQEGVQQLQQVDQANNDTEKSPMDTDKSSIYRHPLFPLLALLFEKCEQCTQGPDSVSSASFDVDIENFVRSQEKESKTFFSEDPELDNLMVKAIQVLRIHLLELEKVNELCKDFCSRYISCLKTKMNSETLLSGEPGSPYSSMQTPTPNSFSSSMSPQGLVVPQGNVTVTTGNTSQTLAGGAFYQPVTVLSPEGRVVAQGLSPSTLRIQNPQQLQLQLNQDLSFFSSEDSSSKNKRGVLPKQATNVMRSWLFQHIGHPYPTEEEKKQIANQTNLTLLQVNNWFINARRRILQPMLDAKSTETPKTKKKTPQNRPLQRFWPDSIASPVSQQQLTMADGTMVTFGMSIDGFQALSSDGEILTMQQVMMDDNSDDETMDSEDEEHTGLSSANMTELHLETSD
ncbi:homeobox protein PKNOX1.1 isoform X1 [Astyanax mexicanus]|uniref:homeobox protein PKNOX1.1 isoform X1 n=1 Tax=Astyanax mexicanus TaxID=7994 RepID=UPI0020CB0197|nr:homeobox protein PKNOX1.1 isoform X1 [Astyanax mexicanus]XP_022535841.2 homeobox protein PKNOX1.1 isoform X1 [Astyanax mexicanus]XP_022535842.2 homeobox protein PKNOX1.1 isoform X1 [Astyanax mexicanus]